MIRRLAAALCGLVLLAATARAQVQPAPGGIRVTLVTVTQGALVFERFGHNALWIRDPATGEDVAFHWGLFDFTDPDFLVRFLTGDTRYSMGGMSATALIEAYRREGRAVTLQDINLTAAQARSLRDFVHWNALEENKYYRYDYFTDNCSTRIRDVLDAALGGAIRGASASAITPLSYRRESVRLTDGDKPAQLGIDIALGRPADAPLSAWDSFFIPMRLRDGLREMRITGVDGVQIPVVSREETLPALGASRVEEKLASPRLAFRYAALGLLLAALVVGLRIMAVSRRTAAWGLALFGSAWSLVSGVTAVVLLLAWTATRHVFWAANENVLLLTPFSLALVVLIPASVLAGRAERPARMVASVVAALGLVAAILALIPGGQENRAIVALFLPVHLSLAWALALPSAALAHPART